MTEDELEDDAGDADKGDKPVIKAGYKNAQPIPIN